MENTSFPPLYCAIAPADLPALGQYAASPVHLAYQLRNGPQLLRMTHPGMLRGGILWVETGQLRQWNGSEPLARQAVGECRARQARGICLNWSQTPTPPLLELTAAIRKAMENAELELWVPEPYGEACGSAKVLISSALSGGTLRRRLTEAMERFGAERVLLATERMRHRFPLPCPTGQGEPVPRKKLEELLEEGTPVFRSEEFCANYFTRQEDGRIALYLFDDGETFREKLSLAGELGLAGALTAWAETQEFAKELFPRRSGAV